MWRLQQEWPHLKKVKKVQAVEGEELEVERNLIDLGVLEVATDMPTVMVDGGCVANPDATPIRPGTPSPSSEYPKRVAESSSFVACSYVEVTVKRLPVSFVHRTEKICPSQTTTEWSTLQ